jgi:hypothetical protein
MNEQEEFSRDRTYYDKCPYLSRTDLEIPHRFPGLMLGLLDFLKRPEKTENWIPELERILKAGVRFLNPGSRNGEARLVPYITRTCGT